MNLEKIRNLYEYLSSRGFKSEARFLTGLFKKAESLKAYHCGHLLTGDAFSTSYLGSGEGGMLALGPGVYFASDPNIALRYCKYVKYPYFYEVEFPMENIYSSMTGEPKRFQEPLQEALKKAAESKGISIGKWGPRGYSHLRHGAGTIGEINFILGPQEAIKVYKELGIDGQWMDLPAGGKEIVIFNPDIIKIINKEKKFEGEIPLQSEYPDFILFGDEIETALSQLGTIIRDNDMEYFGYFKGEVYSEANPISQVDIEKILRSLLSKNGLDAEDIDVYQEDENRCFYEIEGVNYKEL